MHIIIIISLVISLQYSFCDHNSLYLTNTQYMCLNMMWHCTVPLLFKSLSLMCAYFPLKMVCILSFFHLLSLEDITLQPSTVSCSSKVSGTHFDMVLPCSCLTWHLCDSTDAFFYQKMPVAVVWQCSPVFFELFSYFHYIQWYYPLGPARFRL